MSGKKKGKPPVGKDPRPDQVEPGASQENNDGIALNLPKDRGVVKLELMGPDFYLNKALLESYLDDWKRDAKHGRDKQNRSYFYFTDADKCPRRVFYDFTQGDKKRDMQPGTMMLFTFGDLYHDEIQNRLRRLGETTNKHVEFGLWEKKGLPFNKSGRMDVLLRDPEVSGQLAVADIKSKDEFTINGTPDDGEVDQVLSYIEAARNDAYLSGQGWTIAPHGFLIYVARREFKFWRIEQSADRMKAIDEEFTVLWKAIQERTLPTRPYVRDSVDCQYCRYLEYCWEGIPLAEPPKLEPDPTVPAPSQEIVESMARTFLKSKEKIKELEAEEKVAERTLDAYFRSKGLAELVVDGRTIVYATTTTRVIDLEFLKANLKPEAWLAIAKPGVTLMEAAVKAKIIDGTTFERAIRKETSYSVREKSKGKERA